MKRAITVFLAILMIVSIFPFAASAKGNEYEKKTDEELVAEYNAIRLELASRGYTAEEKRVLFDDKDIQIYINGEFSIDDGWLGATLSIPVVIVNKRNNNICVQMRNTSVNGWSCETIFSASVPAQKKMKDELVFELDETDVEKLSDFEDVEFAFHIFDDDSWKDIVNSKSIQIFAD